LQAGQNGSFVYVVGADSKVSVRQVQVAGADADLSAIASGLKAGEQVVTEGQQRLTEGTKVKVGPPSTPEGKPASPNTQPSGGQRPSTVRSARG
jgi:multidrug efflux system membrane fusion protein